VFFPLQVKKDEFQAINLRNVEPKNLLQALRGIGSSKLHSFERRWHLSSQSAGRQRFVASHEKCSSNSNEKGESRGNRIEEFEHLIRQLFGKNVKQAGGKLKSLKPAGTAAWMLSPSILM